MWIHDFYQLVLVKTMSIMAIHSAASIYSKYDKKLDVNSDGSKLLYWGTDNYVYLAMN